MSNGCLPAHWNGWVSPVTILSGLPSRPNLRSKVTKYSIPDYIDLRGYFYSGLGSSTLWRPLSSPGGTTLWRFCPPGILPHRRCELQRPPSSSLSSHIRRSWTALWFPGLGVQSSQKARPWATPLLVHQGTGRWPPAVSFPWKLVRISFFKAFRGLPYWCTL